MHEGWEKVTGIPFITFWKDTCAGTSKYDQSYYYEDKICIPDVVTTNKLTYYSWV